MNQLDADQQSDRAFNWVFWLAVVVLVGVSACLVYLVDYVDQEHAQLAREQKVFAEGINRYLQYRAFRCESESYANDLLLRKINTETEALGETYVPERLVAIPSLYVHPRVGMQSVREEIVEPLTEMLSQARAQGYDLRVNSAYRSHHRQLEMYEYATETLMITTPEKAARPGYSEHQLGSAVDISQYPNNAQVGYDWLRENAYRFGFVLSYPDGAEEVTQYLFEPWHWRYVGIDVARYIHQNNLLFNHQKALLLPSPLVERQELPYEYTGRDVWLWKYLDNASQLETLVEGQREELYFADLVSLMEYFKEGYIQHGGGSIVLPARDWLLVNRSSLYLDSAGESWIRTSLASPDQNEEIERLEVLYRQDVGYVIISYQTQAAGERLVQEFTASCGVAEPS